jgi:hypothetical protein
MKMKNMIPVLSFMVALPGCSPQAKSAANEIIQVAVDTCSEIPNFVPPSSVAGQVVGLLCNVVDSSAQPIETLVDSSVWNQLKADYLKKNGHLPAGMSPPAWPATPPSTSSAAPASSK